MTCREKLAIEHPDKIGDNFIGDCCCCPEHYGYLDRPSYCDPCGDHERCTKCWDREIPDTKSSDNDSHIRSIVDIEVLFDKIGAEWEIHYDPEDESYFIQAIVKKKELSKQCTTNSENASR